MTEPPSSASALISRRELLAGVGAAAVGGTLAGLVGAATAGVAKFPMPTSEELTVLVTGDAGTGNGNQYAVAAAARRVCERTGVDLALGLGDNIYENGPESDTDDEFDTKFERPNAGIDVPWLMILGNHDTSGLIPGSGGAPSRGDHEVAYHHRSPRWYMPSRYYRVALPAANPVVEFFAIDTTPLASAVMQLDPYYAWYGKYAKQQRRWLDAALAESTATWKIVLGHHPLRSNGQHGSAGEYDGITIGHYASGIHVKELYEEVVCGRADLILSGHDHTLQILDTGPTYGGTGQIVCGAAAKRNGAGKRATPAFWEAYDTLGFMMMTIRRDALTIDAYLVDPATGAETMAYRHMVPR